MSEISAISLLYQKPAPSFKAQLLHASPTPPSLEPFSLNEFLGNKKGWVLLVFMPKVDSPEVWREQCTVFGTSSASFTAANSEVFACAYGLTVAPINLSELPLSVLLDDEAHSVGKAYEVLVGSDEDSDFARAIFIISPQGIVRHISLYDEAIRAHDVEEMVNLLRGFQTIDKSQPSTSSSPQSHYQLCLRGDVLGSVLSQLSALSSSYTLAIRERPILTKSLTAAIISIVGELIGSFIVNSRQSKSEGGASSGAGRRVWQVAHRVIVFGLYGLSFTGPFFHWWYRYLHQLVSSWGLSPQLTVVVKVLLNQLAMTPPFLLFTIAYLQFFLSFNRSKTVQTLKKTFATALFVNWRVWTVAQFVNFGLVPMDYQVLFGNIVALWWNIYLSLISSSSSSS